MRNSQIPIIDLFAGPGGLGEGFSSVVDANNNRVFKIVLSIEKDEFAHKTLTLRNFLRQFPFKRLPKEYYQFMRGRVTIDELYKQYPGQASNANNEAWRIELGDKAKEPVPHDVIDNRIIEALEGERNFVLIGGPPCQAYSLVGRARRQEGLGLNKEDERVYLYREYYRILAVHQPAVFIMENVKGLLSSRVENELIFNQLLNDLKDPVGSYRKLHGKKMLPESKNGYKIFSLIKKPVAKNLFFEELEPEDFIIKAENYGIPQARHRVILLGIRDDIKIAPEVLKKADKPITIEDVLSGLPPLRSGLSKTKDGKKEWKHVLYGIENTNLKSLINSSVWNKIENVVNNISVPRSDRGGEFVEWDCTIKYQPEWFLDKKLEGACNHETRAHIPEDLYRYLFAACFVKTFGHSPKLSEFPVPLLPKHKNAASDKFADRFRVQKYGEPSKTITSHISKDGHYFIHPDPSQCRSLTVREAARIQTFPDNYFFCGPRTQQFHQVGNAVPPLLAKQIAEVVANIF